MHSQKETETTSMRNVKEHIPPVMPKPLGPEVIMRMFVNANEAGDGANRRSRTGFFIFLNGALAIAWHSKNPGLKTQYLAPN